MNIWKRFKAGWDERMKDFSSLRLGALILVVLGLLAWHNNSHNIGYNIIGWLIITYLGYRFVTGKIWIGSSDNEEDSP